MSKNRLGTDILASKLVAIRKEHFKNFIRYLFKGLKNNYIKSMKNEKEEQRWCKEKGERLHYLLLREINNEHVY